MRAVALGGLVGLAVAHLAHGATGHLPARPPTVPELSAIHRRTLVIVAMVAIGLWLPPAAPLLPLALWTRRHVRAQRARRAHRRGVRVALPDLVDLLVLASSAGLALPVAHPRVAAHLAAPVGPALAIAHAEAGAGRPRADALVAALAPLGDRACALAHVLVDHLRYGVPLLPGLERMGLELRLDRRRQAEQEARRVPVRLLGPLLTCVLPAFALLTVVPLLAASLESLPSY